MLPEIFSRIDDGTILVNFKVTVRTRAISRAAHGGDILSLLHGIASRNCQRAIMGVPCLISVPMVDDDDISLAIFPTCEGNSSRAGSVDCRPLRIRNINPPVLSAPASSKF